MSNSNEVVELLRQINANLSILKKLTELQLRGTIKEELEKIASTTERKKMWALCDGTISTSEIARKVRVSNRAVQYFVQEATKAELMRIDKRGFPYRNVDWIPPDWEDMLKGITKGKQIEEEVREDETKQ